MEDQDTELRNPFPSPPSHYTKYTSHNLKLLALLLDRSSDPHSDNQHQILADQTDVPDWPLVQLEKPRIDWILGEPDAYYFVFGDRWFVRPTRSFLRRLASMITRSRKISHRSKRWAVNNCILQMLA